MSKASHWTGTIENHEEPSDTDAEEIGLKIDGVIFDTDCPPEGQGTNLDKSKTIMPQEYSVMSSNNSNGTDEDVKKTKKLKKKHVKKIDPAKAAQRALLHRQALVKYGSEQVVKLYIPVTLCMALVVFSLHSIPFFSEHTLAEKVLPFHDEEAEAGKKALMTIGNVIILLIIIISITLFLVMLYKHRCYKVIYGWLATSTLFILSFLTFLYFTLAAKALNCVIDIPTTVIIIWNFGSYGLMCIHWKGPLMMQQLYLICISAFAALFFLKFMPDWSVWGVLFVLILWDLFAVLCPHGPLRMMVEIAEEREEEIFPALIYSAMLWTFGFSDMEDRRNKSVDEPTSLALEPINASTVSSEVDIGFFSSPKNVSISELQRESTKPKFSSIDPSRDLKGKPSKNADECEEGAADRQASPVKHDGPQHVQKREVTLKRVEEEEEEGMKLGLGDFVFYSVLVGKASTSNDWTITLACVIAILVGLCFTLILLTVFNKTLPALPISLSFGIFVHFGAQLFVQHFVEHLNFEQVYI